VSNEPQGEIVETKVSTAAKEKKPVTEKRSAHPLSWVNLVLMLVLIAIMGFAVWLGWQQQRSTTAEVAVLRDHLNTALQTLDQTSAREHELMSRAESLAKSSQQLQEQVAHNTERLGKLPGVKIGCSRKLNICCV
jgi:uroporphyrin-3 C-methyltransferase